MVALHVGDDESTRRSTLTRRTPLLWRVMMTVDRWLVLFTGKLVVTGEVPPELRDRPLLLAANHIGNFDPFVLIAACRQVGVAPRFLLAAGLLNAPVVGAALRRSGHLPVERGKLHEAANAMDRAVRALREAGPVAVYPEGRISLDPGLWPERGKTGVARIALASGVTVLPVSQWGAHEAACWGNLTIKNWGDVKPILFSWFQAVRARPVFQVHFGAPVDLTGLSATRPGDAVRARDRIMRAITAGLCPLRADEPDKPTFSDPTRPTDRPSPWKP